MKKVLLTLTVIGSVAFLTSCKKNWTCSCVSHDTCGGVDGSSTWTIKTTKKKAKDWCDLYNSSSSYGGCTYTETCSLK